MKGMKSMVNSYMFQAMTKTVTTDSNRRVDHIDVELMVRDYVGTFYFTDIMFQSGTVATSWVGHVSEIRWSFDNA
ncbi:hypothetical protein BpsM61_00063 [Bacillus phage vB_BpsM-61]|nr:hypothetical protein BpsM61_00063 [Bacillus phage vB_BpsM-61]